MLAYAVSQGVVPVAAAGNDRDTVMADGTTNPVLYPAALPHIVSVAATGPTGATSAFSTSNGAVDLAAPGEGVLTAVPTAWDDDGVADGYERLDGTSFAAPIVAGAAAWLRAARPNLSAGQIADLLRLSATDIGARGWDEDSGYGLVNIKAALTRARPGDRHARGQRRHLMGRRPPPQQAGPVPVQGARPQALAARRRRLLEGLRGRLPRAGPGSPHAAPHAHDAARHEPRPRGLLEAGALDLQDPRPPRVVVQPRRQDRAHHDPQRLAARPRPPTRPSTRRPRRTPATTRRTRSASSGDAVTA